MIERLQEPLAIPIRKDDRCFFRETNLILRDHARLADAQLVLAHLLDDDRRIGERFGQADAALRIRRSRFQAHVCPFSRGYSIQAYTRRRGSQVGFSHQPFAHELQWTRLAAAACGIIKSPLGGPGRGAGA